MSNNVKIEIVLHLAAYAVQSRENDANLAYKLNVEATKNLAQHAADCGCARFVYLGTAREYGDVQNTVTEAQPTNPVCLYGKTYAYTCELEIIILGTGKNIKHYQRDICACTYTKFSVNAN